MKTEPSVLMYGADPAKSSFVPLGTVKTMQSKNLMKTDSLASVCPRAKVLELVNVETHDVNPGLPTRGLISVNPEEPDDSNRREPPERDDSDEDTSDDE